ncbi:MAG: ATP-binding protein [Candidatus Omnitrophota bacterium]
MVNHSPFSVQKHIFCYNLSMFEQGRKNTQYIRKQMSRVIKDYSMINEGDRILIAVSGGKDSLCLLEMLRARQSFSPVKYEISPVHFNEETINAHILEKYLKSNNYSYRIVGQIEKPRKKPRKSPCFNCSWERRKRLFQIAEELKCNKIALAHHMDDIIQTTLLNLFFMGEISTMRPYQELFGGKCHIIRPLAYVPEKALAAYSKARKFPKMKVQCPHGKDSARKFISDEIKRIEKRSPEVRKNVFRSLKRIRSDYLL